MFKIAFEQVLQDFRKPGADIKAFCRCLAPPKWDQRMLVSNAGRYFAKLPIPPYCHSFQGSARICICVISKANWAASDQGILERAGYEFFVAEDHPYIAGLLARPADKRSKRVIVQRGYFSDDMQGLRVQVEELLHGKTHVDAEVLQIDTVHRRHSRYIRRQGFSVNWRRF